MIKLVGFQPDLREIRCDAVGCETRRLQDGGSAREAREGAAKRGWQHGAHPKADRTLDVCPECVREMAKKEADA